MPDFQRDLIDRVLRAPAQVFGSWRHKIILLELVRNSYTLNGRLECPASLAHIGFITGFSRCSVRRSLQQLHAAKLVKTVQDPGSSNLYQIEMIDIINLTRQAVAPSGKSN